MASHIEEDDDPQSAVKALFPDLHARSHGESLLTLIEERMTTAGLYVLDEPESRVPVRRRPLTNGRLHQGR